MKSRLTERQNQVYEYIRAFMRKHRKPPTHKEICEALGMASTNGVHKLLVALETKGYVQRIPNAARGLTLTDAEDPYALDDELPSLPVISRTASDQPDRLRKSPRAYFTIDPYFLVKRDPDACLVARAGDDGMNPDGVRKGDFVIVEERELDALKNGDLAVFLVREEVHVRRFHFVNGRLHLRPADRTYTEETYPPDDPGCYVVGKVVGVMRRL